VLDVTTLLDEPEEVSEFENLDLAANMLFLAGECSYFIARELSCAAQSDRFRRNGLSVLFQHTAQWCEAFETTYGISNRKIPWYKGFEQAKMSANFAIFGQPIREGLVDICCINRVVLSAAFYSVHFGPVMED